MSADPSVIAALEAAVAADPSNAAIRIHLASLLVMAGDATRALEHPQAALAVTPDDPEALMAARDAAQALGDTTRASGYTRLLGLPQESTPEPELELRETLYDGPDFVPDDIDGILEADRPRITLADVGGLEEVKARLDSAFLAPLRRAQRRQPVAGRARRRHRRRRPGAGSWRPPA